MDVDLLLVPYDTALRGWRMGAGPEHLVAAGLISRLDLDALDPAEGRANPFPAAGGLTAAELESTLREIGRSVPVRAAAVTAYASEYDTDGRIAKAALRIIEALLAAAGGT